MRIPQEVKSTSREVAKNFERSHSSVVRKIDRMCKVSPQASALYQQTGYISENGRKYTEYLMGRDGLMLLVMGFTGKKALKIKLEYIKEFNRMEDELRKGRKRGY